MNYRRHLEEALSIISKTSIVSSWEAEDIYFKTKKYPTIADHSCLVAPSLSTVWSKRAVAALHITKAHGSAEITSWKSSSSLCNYHFFVPKMSARLPCSSNPQRL